LSQRQVGVVFASREGLGELQRLVTGVVDMWLRLNVQFQLPCSLLSTQNLKHQTFGKPKTGGCGFCMQRGDGGTAEVGVRVRGERREERVCVRFGGGGLFNQNQKRGSRW
ncbi:MAG: hypothetical protein JSV09_07220, partial [Thermoplasmata archaeon]